MSETTIFDIVSITVVSPTAGLTPIKDLKFIVQDFNIYESIYNSTVSGDITIKDANNELTEMALCGNEYLYIEFIKSEDEIPYSKFFRIYKVSDVTLHNFSTLTYKIHFASEEFVLNQQIRLSKSYKGFYNFQAVADILLNYLNVNPERFEFEETINPLKQYIVPNLRPLEAINALTVFSLNPTLTSAFLFFETYNGFKFLSLETLYKKGAFKTLTIYPQNIMVDQYNKTADRSSITELEIPQLFDTLQLINNGGASASMLKMDLINQSYEAAASNPVNITPFTTLNEFLPFNNIVNRFGTSLIDGSSYMRYFSSHDDPLVDKWLLQRANQLALLNNNRVNVKIAGDTELEAGDVVYLDFPYFQPLNNNDETVPDPYKAGNYLITGLRHRIADNKYVTYLELCKDSVISAFPAAKYNTSELIKVASES
jgi:hypothetical protein